MISHSVAGTTAINDGSFHYVVGSRASGVLSIYVDGAFRHNVRRDGNGHLATRTNLGISMRSDGFAGMGYLARLDEVRISNIARPAGWIATEFTTTKVRHQRFTASDRSRPMEVVKLRRC